MARRSILSSSVSSTLGMLPHCLPAVSFLSSLRSFWSSLTLFRGLICLAFAAIQPLAKRECLAKSSSALRRLASSILSAATYSVLVLVKSEAFLLLVIWASVTSLLLKILESVSGNPSLTEEATETTSELSLSASSLSPLAIALSAFYSSSSSSLMKKLISWSESPGIVLQRFLSPVEIKMFNIFTDKLYVLYCQ